MVRGYHCLCPAVVVLILTLILSPPPTSQVQASSTNFPCHHTTNQSQLNSFLWTIKRAPPHPPSFLFGTIHVPYTKVWDYIPHNTKDAFDRSDSVFFELDLTDPFTISALANCQLLPAGKNLSNILPPDLYYRLKRHLDYVKLMMPMWMTADQRGRGLYADYLFNAIAGNWERKRPVWVMLMVNSLTESDIKTRGIPVLDLYMAQEAERANQNTGAVERVEEQCVPLNELNFSQVLFALNQTLKQHENYRSGTSTMPYTTADLIQHYNCGDLNTIIFSHDTAQVPNLLNTSLGPTDVETAKHIDDYFRQELIYRRNERMAQRVSNLLEKNPNNSFFFAFGAGHFLGNNTVIHTLEKMGYEVEYVAPDAEVYLGENWKYKRRKNPSRHDYPMPPIIVRGETDGRNREERRRIRHRHRQRGRRKGKKKDKERNGPVTDSDHLKRPQFNDLWVRLEATSFGPDSFLRQQQQKDVQEKKLKTEGPQPSPVYAMHSGAAHHTVPSHLLTVVIVILTWVLHSAS